MSMTIVVPAVRSPAGERALDLAKREAAARDAEMVLVANATVTEKVGEEVEAIREFLAELEGELTAAGFRCRSEWSVGETLARATLDAAKKYEADLIVLGLRQRSSVGKALLGSYEQEILLDAPCPVLSIRAPHR